MSVSIPSSFPGVIQLIQSVLLVKHFYPDECLSFCGPLFILFLCHRELGIGIVAYSPLGHGFFGGKAVVEDLPTNSAIVCVLNLDGIQITVHICS